MPERRNNRRHVFASFAAVMLLSASVGLADNETQDYSDPKGYYTVKLPSGFRETDQSAGSRSKRSFSYSPKLSMWIIASQMQRPWNPEAAMREKVEALTSGRPGMPPGLKVVSNRLLEFGGASGYELILDMGGDQSATTYAMVGKDTSLSISITCQGDEERPRYEAIAAAIRKTLQIRQSQVAAPADKPSASAVSCDWDGARAAVRINGVMKSQGGMIALIDRGCYEEGDTVATVFKGNEYKFKVASIGNDESEVVLEPVKP